MTLQTPIVSVCIPTYKGAATIGAAIESVLGQSFASFELIVIDDGSPDATRLIVESFADPRITYLRNDHNLGPEDNWNRCLEVARGKYFKLLPHDDLLHPQCLATRKLSAYKHMTKLPYCSTSLMSLGLAVTLSRTASSDSYQRQH